MLVLWIMAEAPLWMGASGTRRAGDALMQGTGVLAIILMSLSLILANRPHIVEPWIGGLDKMYRLHKWLGIANLIVAAIHWQSYGLVRGSETEASSAQAARNWEGLFPNQHDLAVFIGDQAWKLVLVLSILALVKRFPYRWFFKTHWLFVPTYLLLVFHAAVLLDSRYWLTPLGFVLTAVVLAGTVSGIVRLLYMHYSDHNGFLTAQHLQQAVPQLAGAHIWFCGPAAMGKSLKDGLQQLGVPKEHFHQELFEMR